MKEIRFIEIFLNTICPLAGNSIIADRVIAPHAFSFAAEFPQAFADGGFDVVIGNPPYVRRGFLSGSIKPYLQSHHAAHNRAADLYVYLYEKGLKILKPNGTLSYIVTNKWFKSGYGESLAMLLFLKMLMYFPVLSGHGNLKVSKAPKSQNHLVEFLCEFAQFPVKNWKTLIYPSTLKRL
ncbi:MAG: Eco57I restriction-modification methylase domain-containing protein [Leptolyngbya sp. IPPAS B-1204]